MSLTPAEAGQNTVKQREYNPDTSLPALAARGFYPPVSVRRISKNRCRKLRAYDGQHGSKDASGHRTRPTVFDAKSVLGSGVGPSYVGVNSEFSFQNRVFSDLRASFLPVRLDP